MPRRLPKRLAEVAETHPLPEGRIWLVMIPYGWGRSPDLGMAARSACQYGSGATPAKGPLTVYHIHPDSAVTGMGDIEYPLDSDENPGRDRHRHAPTKVADFARKAR